MESSVLTFLLRARDISSDIGLSVSLRYATPLTAYGSSQITERNTST